LDFLASQVFLCRGLLVTADQRAVTEKTEKPGWCLVSVRYVRLKAKLAPALRARRQFSPIVHW
jgi:hypothetical protein